MIATLALFATLALPPVQEETAATEVAGAGMEAVEALRSEFDKANQAFFKAYGEATEEERPNLLANERPNPDEWADRFLALAEEHPLTEAAAASYAWVAQNAQDEEKSGLALTILLEDHIESPQVAHICQTLLYRLSDGAEYLERILEESPHEDVRGQACYALGKNLLSQASMARRLSGMKDEEREPYVSYLGSAYERILSADAASLEKAAEECFERVIVEYPEGDHWSGTLAEAAEGDLFQIRNLGLGMVAPDIEGEDIEGVSFKLSDYRGKVVLLDFWGHW